MKAIYLLAVCCLAAATSAIATDFSTKLTQLDGSPFTEADGKPEVSPTTLKKVSINALLANYPDETNLSGEVKLARFNLAKKISDSNGELSLTLEEATMLKAIVQKGMPIIVVGQAIPLIEKSVK